MPRCRDPWSGRVRALILAPTRELAAQIGERIAAIARTLHSPFITSFRNPANFSFRTFYEELKARGFVIYPGKVSMADCFRIGTIGDITPRDIRALLAAVAVSDAPCRKGTGD